MTKLSKKIKDLEDINSGLIDQLLLYKNGALHKDLQIIMADHNEAMERIKVMEAALVFYSSPGDYAAPRTGHTYGDENKLYFDCGETARNALNGNGKSRTPR